MVKYTNHVTAVDASPEVLAINKEKVGTNKVTFVQVDFFDWQPSTQYDAVFFSFWLSHVPPERFQKFWQLVRTALKPNGRVFFVDSLKSEGSKDTKNNPKELTSLRKLNDGQTFTIIKVFYKPKELEQRLENIGWNIVVKNTANYFLYGYGGRL